MYPYNICKFYYFILGAISSEYSSFYSANLSAKFNPLAKVQPIIDIVSRNLRRAWILGQKISVDESMIRCMGRFVTFVQFMPANKPIKHVIKVFAFCCAYTGYLYAFVIYTGTENGMVGSPEFIVDKLLHLSKLTCKYWSRENPVHGQLLHLTGSYETHLQCFWNVHGWYVYVDKKEITYSR